jgi:hypothetical protein
MPRQWIGNLAKNEFFIRGGGHSEETLVAALGEEWRIVAGGTPRNVCKDVCAGSLSDAI